MSENNNTKKNLNSNSNSNNLDIIGCGNIKWCPVHNCDMSRKGHYSVMTPSNIPPPIRDHSPNSQMPQSLPNGGIFGGPQSNKPWANIPTPANATNYTSELLKSANPPEEALSHIHHSRMGNSYVAQPNTYWYNPTDMPNCSYRIMGILPK